MAETMPRTEALVAACTKLARQAGAGPWLRGLGSGDRPRAARSSSGCGLLVGRGGGGGDGPLRLSARDAPPLTAAAGEPSFRGETGETGEFELPPAAVGRAGLVGDAYGSAAGAGGRRYGSGPRGGCSEDRDGEASP
jgi:hypothetical protein